MKAERIPFVLAAADFLAVAFLTSVFLPHRLSMASVPILALLVAYACGDYSLFVELRSRRRLGILLAAGLFLLLAATPLLESGHGGSGSVSTAVRLGGAAAGCIAWVLGHQALERRLASRSGRYTFHMDSRMRPAGEAIGRHLARSGYPARILFDGECGGPGGRVPVEVEDPRRNARDPRSRRVLSLDPARFCDEVLRVLPPAVLAEGCAVRWDGPSRRFYDRLKRFFDVGGALVLLVLSAPLMAVAAVGIRIADGGPVLFRQVRVGRGGKRFLLRKFRTLRSEPASAGTPNDGIEERAFSFGTFLRATRLDELPQLINVLRGHMSLIGPRPEMEFFHDKAVDTIPFYARRLAVRPGITGWAQVRFRHTTDETDYWDKTAYDLWYVRHRGPITDLRIAVRTAGVMLFGSGAR